MKRIETRDGSFTFLNEKFGETYHCKTVGALEESKIKYARPANIKEGDNILDFCFGLGYNSIAALSICKNITITGIEIDKKIINEIESNTVPKEFKEANRIMCESLKNQDDKINLIIGDASKEIKKLANNSFNAILFDPFSPGKHKELWSLDVFNDCFRVLKAEGRLTTYSCATWIRNNLREAGFKVIDGPIFGRKSASTIAIKKQLIPKV